MTSGHGDGSVVGVEGGGGEERGGGRIEKRGREGEGWYVALQGLFIATREQLTAQFMRSGWWCIRRLRIILLKVQKATVYVDI